VGGRVHADPHDPETPPLELFVIPGVADQLPVAVRSPIAPVKHEDQRSFPEGLVKIEGQQIVVRQLEVRNPPVLAWVAARLGHI
jgi:hypothetical protein